MPDKSGRPVTAQMTRIWQAYDRLMAFLTGWAARLGGLLILAVGFFVFYEVVCRYVFGSPTPWVMDYSIYFIMWAVLLGCAHNMRTRGHVMVDVVVAKLGSTSRRVIEFTIHLLIFAFSVTLTAAGVKSCLRAVEMNELTMSALFIPLVYPLSAVPVGFLLLAFEEFRAIFGLLIFPSTRSLIDQEGERES
jgi:TRAP-type C4-dicarboxylate transport system permease small subunit